MTELELASPVYQKVECVHLSKLHKRLRSFLDTEARLCPAGWPITKVFAKRKKRPVAAAAGGPAAGMAKARGGKMSNMDVDDDDMMVIHEEEDNKARLLG